MRSFKFSVSLICTVLLASGCASYNHNTAVAKATNGDCDGARTELSKGVGAGNARAISSMGWLYEICYNDSKTAIGYYKLGARKGDDWARSQLVRLGQQIPSSDLVKRLSPMEQQMMMDGAGKIGRALGGALGR